MHHLSTELFSISDSMLIPIFKHQIPIHPWISVFHPKYHHWTAFIAQQSINMSNSHDLKSIFEDPSDIKMEYLSKPNCTLKLKTILTVNLIKDSTWAVPHHGCCSSAYTHGTHCGFPAFIEWINISPIIPTDPLFPPHLQPQRPFHLGRGHHGSREGTQFVRVEARDQDHYWITCWVDNTGFEFAIQDHGLVIDPNSQDVLSQLDQVRILIWLWWGHLSKLVQWSKRMQYWWLGREMWGRCECREGHSGMSSEVQRIGGIKIDWAVSSLIASSFTFWWFYEHFWHHSS